MISHEISLITLLELLNGYKSPLLNNNIENQLLSYFQLGKIGYSQFNELQLSLGFNRVSEDFFYYLVNQSLEDIDNDYFESIEDIDNDYFESIEEMRVSIIAFLGIALFFYGSIEQAFKILSVDENELDQKLGTIRSIPISYFENRCDPIHQIKKISGKNAYYLGHIVQRDLKKAHEKDPENQKIKDEYYDSKDIIKIGKENYASYLASDHLDVYIATSMREKEDYYMVNKWVNEIFNHESLKNLKLRWFDPTQAFCDSRVDKGLFEGLMLKRSKCTVYFVQESDTFGKDSELASTLAQGKPVIAFIPIVNREYLDEFIEHLQDIHKDKEVEEIILDKLKEYHPELAWVDKDVQKWLSDPSTFQKEKAKELLLEKISDTYDKRASLLSEQHPLGIQVCLENGVANGVLVVRDLESCARIIERVVRRTMKFDLEVIKEGDHSYYYLKEDISKCIYRLATGDQMLTNSFWNYYNTKID